MSNRTCDETSEIVLNRLVTTSNKGDDFDVSDNNDMATAGIHVGDHGNAIEVHASTLIEAQTIRDYVLGKIHTSRIDYLCNYAKGPWRYLHDRGEANRSVIYRVDNGCEHWVMGIHHNGEYGVAKQDATTRLVAAAPELFEVVEMLLELPREHIPPDFREKAAVICFDVTQGCQTDAGCNQVKAPTAVENNAKQKSFTVTPPYCDEDGWYRYKVHFSDGRVGISKGWGSKGGALMSLQSVLESDSVDNLEFARDELPESNTDGEVHYAVIGRIPFDDEDTVYFYKNVPSEELRRLFTEEIYADSGRDDQGKVSNEHGTPVFITNILSSKSSIRL